MKNSNILLVEDNADMRRTIKDGLERDGYLVHGVSNGKDLISRLKEHLPDIILLDIGLPDENGLGLMEKIREYTDVPVIVVSGRNDSVDRIIGLEMGADDYVGKPFQIKELSARIKAQLRRNGPINEKKTPSLNNAEKVEFGGWILDRARLQVFDRDGNSVGMTVKEFKLLESFILSPNRVLTREQLLDSSRSHNLNVTDRAIDTQIVRIRKKLGDNENIIQSVRGAGYMFSCKINIIS